ncbi:MAG: MazG nucleotide pyrophosphohydrolase domain-containing protein [Acidimicrobiia bacterium]
MDFADYQRRATSTDQRPVDDAPAEHRHSDRSTDALVIPLLGIGGELGTLQAEYKKFLRDGDSYRPFVKHIQEELGDILWYVSNLASKFGLDLETIASQNLEKVEDRWGGSPVRARGEEDLYDTTAPAGERLPRQFEVEFHVQPAAGRPEPIVQAFWNGQPFGDPLGDNAHVEDGYRFHDAFHLAHCAILGWSPVSRRSNQFDCKRRSDAATDAVEDGGRAIVIEEAVVAYIYGHARDHGWFETVDAVDYSLLKTIRGLTSDLEVASRPARDWERAILDGYAVWRQLRQNDGGVVVGNLFESSISYRPLD